MLVNLPVGGLVQDNFRQVLADWELIEREADCNKLTAVLSKTIFLRFFRKNALNKLN
jgi:hypothetical protein